MTNKDKLLCVFENAGIDISKYRKLKEENVFNEKRNEYLKKNDSEVNRALKKKTNTYADLCDIEHSIVKSEKKVYGKFPSNPFLYNYKSRFLGNLRICDCVQKVNGVELSIEKVSKLESIDPNEALEDIKENIFYENNEYIQKRKNHAIEACDNEYFKNDKFDFARSSTVTRIINVIIFSILLLVVFNVSPIRENIENIFDLDLADENVALNILVIAYGIYTMADIYFFRGNRNRVMRRISDKYERVERINESLYKKTKAKSFLSKNKLSTLDNFCRYADMIDSEYAVKNNNAIFFRRYSFIKGLYNLSFIAILVTCFMIFGFWYALLFIILSNVIKAVAK